MTDYNYVGSELDLFEAAIRWKSYLGRRIAPYLGSVVLEVGAGFGGTTRHLCRGEHMRWVCLEPDATLADRLADSIDRGALPSCCQVLNQALDRMEPASTFDSVIYIDVLEHIEDDRGELARAATHLKPGGHLVVLSPAHSWLFTPFDEAIGHYRRYTKRGLQDVTPQGLEIVRLSYLDSVGLLASLGNRLLLKSAMPNPRQIRIWDRYMVRLSEFVDPLTGHLLGKSVLGIWRKAL